MADQEKIICYGYSVSLDFIVGNTITAITEENINNIVIDKGYATEKNMPTIYITCVVNTPLYNSIGTNTESGSFLLQISKFDIENPGKGKKKYIKEELAYKSTIDPYAIADLTDEESEVKKDDWHRITIGLYKKDLANNNKKRLINGIYKSVNSISVVHKFTSHMKMLIEPFDNNNNIPTLIIPPIESVSELLKYLNYYYGFYNTPYIFFMDFNLSYLISTKGKEIDAKDNTFNTIKITIRGKDSESITQGIRINSTKKIYLVDTVAKNVDINKNKATDNQVNILSGVSADGFTITQNIKANKDKASTSKEKYIKVHNNNLSYIKQLKAQAEMTATVVNIYLENVDNSLFTPNKEYTIVSKNSTIKNIDGKYFLASKKEVYLFTDGKFNSNLILTMYRIS